MAACRLDYVSEERYKNRREKAAQCLDGIALRLFKKIGRLHSAARLFTELVAPLEKKFSCLALEEYVLSTTPKVMLPIHPPRLPAH